MKEILFKMQARPIFISIDVVAIVCLSIGILIASLILSTIIQKPRSQKTIAHLLLCNTCVCTLELCISYLIIYGFILKNDIVTNTIPNQSTFDQEYLCPLRSYFLFSGFSLLYTSYCLQAYYRLRQVIFYKQRCSYRVFVIIIILQWMFSFLLILPMYLTNSFQYISSEYFCPIPFSRPWSVAYIAITVYGVCLTIFIGIYLWIYTYANRTTLITLQRRRSIDRQMTMLKRIILPTCSLMFLGIVYLTLFFQALINQYQTHDFTYRLSYLFIAIGLSLIHLITIYLTPGFTSEILACLLRRVIPIRRGNNEETKQTLPVVTTIHQEK